MCRTLVESNSGSYAGQDRAAGDAEDDLDAGVLERPDQALRAGDLDRAGGPYRRREVGR